MSSNESCNALDLKIVNIENERKALFASDNKTLSLDDKNNDILSIEISLSGDFKSKFCLIDYLKYKRNI